MSCATTWQWVFSAVNHWLVDPVWLIDFKVNFLLLWSCCRLITASLWISFIFVFEPRHLKTNVLHMVTTANLISAFVFATLLVQYLYFLTTKFQASSRLLWLHSPICVGAGWKPQRWFPHDTTQSQHCLWSRMKQVATQLQCVHDGFLSPFTTHVHVWSRLGCLKLQRCPKQMKFHIWLPQINSSDLKIFTNLYGIHNRIVSVVHAFQSVNWAATWENRIFAYAKTKMQISFRVTTKLMSAFVFTTWIVQSLCFLNPKFQV